MAHKHLAIAVGLSIAASPAMAASLEPAPEAGAGARYCLRLDAFTGSRIESIRCWTRDQWADQGVDVDKEWAKNGVSVIDQDGNRSVKS